MNILPAVAMAEKS